jgi:uncharacterized RDD family membrane protein YckC
MAGPAHVDRRGAGGGGPAPSVIAGAAGLIGDAIGSALAGAVERLREPEGGSTPEGGSSPEGSTPPRPSPRPAAGPRPADAGPGRAPGGLAADAIARLADAVLERIDLDAALARIDVQRVIARIDLDAVVAEVDVDGLVSRVDVGALVERVDVGAVAQEAIEEIDLMGVIREATASVGSETAEALRDQAAGADGLVARVVDRPLGRAGRVAGAGVVSRLAAVAVDLLAVVAIWIGLLVVAAGVRALFTSRFDLTLPPSPWGRVIVILLLVAYLAYGWSLNGRTPGMGLFGLRVVRQAGGGLGLPQAIARALAYLVFPAGILWVALSSRNASLQDLVVRTAVVYDRGHPLHRG